MAIAREIETSLSSASFIRKMFETGALLKREHGEEAVCDFSLGNPSLPPPPEFTRTLVRYAGENFPGKHAYMPNVGYPDVREKLARYISREWETPLGADNLIMTCGAAGGLNVILKTLLNPGDEVLVNAPFFMEYKFYVANNGGRFTVIPPGEGLDLNLVGLEKALGPRSTVVLLNSPNNPSGKVYSEQTLRALALLLEDRSRKNGRPVYLINDEPYRKLVYSGQKVSSILALYPHSIVVSSFSKELSIPGERIGWIAVNPRADAADMIRAGANFCTRTLGFVNAPALMQKVVGDLAGLSVDVSLYKQKRDRFCAALQEMGYELDYPDGTFYIFPRAPGGDDMRVCEILQKHLILVVPGRGFGCPGYFRIAYCVSDEVIERSFSGFTAALKELQAGG